jgi:two-component system, cell cycle response regulator
MFAHQPISYLLASPDPTILQTVEPIVQNFGARASIAVNAQGALEILTSDFPPALVILDTTLPGMEIGPLLSAAQAKAARRSYPIVLIADDVIQEWSDRLVEGVIDDVILRDARPEYWRLRIDLALRTHRMGRELDSLREVSTLHSQLDRLTGTYNRKAMLTMMFRETDRVQRMKSSLSLLLLDIDDFGHWNERLGADVCDELLCKVCERTTRTLRSYDVLGRPGKDEFLILLPGCTTENAMMLAERLRQEVFSEPFRVSGESIRLSACFGVAASLGRSPVVVLREAEQALQWAKSSGPESIEFFGEAKRPAHAPLTYLSPTSGDELLAW